MKTGYYLDKDERHHSFRAADDDRTVTIHGLDCPECFGLGVFISHQGKEAVRFRHVDRAAAVAHFTDRGLTWEEVLEPEHLVLQGENPWKTDTADKAEAVCTRCRSRLGLLVVPLNTIFGRREDELIISGQYGLVIEGR